MKKICAIALACALGGMSATASAQDLLAWWSFNNSHNSDKGDGLYVGTSNYYHTVILNENFDDGFWTGPNDGFVASGVDGDLMYPVHDMFYGDNGALVPDAADNYPGSTVADTAAFLATYGSQYGAVLNVENLVGANDGSTQNNTWTSYQGTGLNRAGGSFGGGSLAMTGTVNNGSSFQIEADLTNWIDIEVSWANRGTSTGYTGRVVEVSTDGVNWTDIYTDAGALSSTWSLETADAGTLLDNATTAYIRWTVEGASSTNGNNRFDNIQLRGTFSEIPEPATLSLLALSGLALIRRR